MYDRLSYTNSDELCEQMAKECDTCLLAFSLGKDSVAAWLQCRKYFKTIIPFYKYNVPGLEFVEDNLKYYEEFFGQHIYRMPHPASFAQINAGNMQTPLGYQYVYDNKPFPAKKDYNGDSVPDIIRYFKGLSENVYVAVGLRQSDSPMRRMNIKTHGAIIHNKQTFYPVYDWLKDRLLQEFDEAGVKLSTDYQLWNNSFDGITYKYLRDIRRVYPKDYEKIKMFFPLADLQFLRRGETDGILG